MSSSFKKMTLIELKNIAKELNIKGRSKKNKKELIKLIEDNNINKNSIKSPKKYKKISPSLSPKEKNNVSKIFL